MRIARIIARLNVGGPARHVVWLSQSMRTAGFETLLVTGTVPPGEQDMSAFAGAHDVRPHLIREMSRELSPADAVTVWKLFRLFRRFRPDVVHTHTAKAGATGRVAAFAYRWLTPAALWGRPRSCKVIHTYHGHVFHGYYGPARTAVFLWIERALARITDRIVVLSPQQLEEIHGTFRVGRREQFRVVPLGLDLAELRAGHAAGEALRRELAIPLDAVVTGIVGRLTPIKNHELFIDAVSRVAADRPEAFFVIFGEGAERDRLEGRARSSPASSHIRFAGTREPAEIYGAIDIAALTSRNEGTPLTIIEAMANAIPAVSTAVGGVVDLLGEVEHADDGVSLREHGVTVQPGDAAAFARALTRLIDDPALRRRLGASARERVATAHTKERLVADIIALVREVAPDAAFDGEA